MADLIDEQYENSSQRKTVTLWLAFGRASGAAPGHIGICLWAVTEDAGRE